MKGGQGKGAVMGAAENKELIQKVFTEMSQGNAKPLLAILGKDICWTVIGTTKLSGTFRGKQEIYNRLLKPLGSQLQSNIKITVKSLMADGDQVVVEGSGKALTKEGKTYNNTYCWVLKLAEGKVTEMTEYLDTELVIKTFGR